MSIGKKIQKNSQCSHKWSRLLELLENILTAFLDKKYLYHMPILPNCLFTWCKFYGLVVLSTRKNHRVLVFLLRLIKICYVFSLTDKILRLTPIYIIFKNEILIFVFFFRFPENHSNCTGNQHPGNGKKSGNPHPLITGVNLQSQYKKELNFIIFYRTLI